MLNAVLLALVLSAVTSATNESGTGNFLQCYANSALEASKGKVICHLDAKFCIQEITNATRRSDCGLGKHSTDVWDRKLSKCIYRKCSNKCPSFEDDRLRDFPWQTMHLGCQFELSVAKRTVATQTCATSSEQQIYHRFCHNCSDFPLCYFNVAGLSR